MSKPKKDQGEIESSRRQRIINICVSGYIKENCNNGTGKILKDISKKHFQD